MKDFSCPVCRQQDGFECEVHHAHGDKVLFNCQVCGWFGVARTVIGIQQLEREEWTKRKRSSLSHWIANNSFGVENCPTLTTHFLDDFLKDAAEGPTPSAQATNIIRIIGDLTKETGESIGELPPSFTAKVGSPDRNFAFSILRELGARGLVQFHSVSTLDNPHDATEISLTLAGWDAYEDERKGRTTGGYGFVALQFGDSILDPLLNDHLKPRLRELGLEVVDIRDVARAGVIDNILRVQIRDADFVLVDLTHENAGAYWEAGYAEGLGKPVLYLCEKSKFEEQKTHFDTNHCTTIMWDAHDVEGFITSLVATLRRSLPAR